MTSSTPTSRHASLKYGGKAIVLIEQDDGRYNLLNFAHALIATDTLENLIPLIRAYQGPPPPPGDTPLVALDLDLTKLGL